jgi:hypothetical protein
VVVDVSVCADCLTFVRRSAKQENVPGFGAPQTGWKDGAAVEAVLELAAECAAP